MDRRHFLIAGAAASVTGLATTWTAPVLAQPNTPDPHQKYSLVGFDDSAGKLLRLENFAGKVVLVSFFTSGCNLCNRDLKLMREFYVNNKKKDFMLLGVNMDESKGDFEDYKRLIDLSVPKEQSFPIVWRKGPEYVDNFGQVTKKPTHFVLDKNQKLVFRREGTFLPDDWDTLWTKITG